MECLYCGDCCQRMSPIEGDGADKETPCRFMDQEGTFYFCKVYPRRPEQCVNHEYHSRFCPIGILKLTLTDPVSLSKRIDDGWELLKKMEKKWMMEDAYWSDRGF